MEAAASLPAARTTGTDVATADQWEADALQALDSVDTPEAAEELLARIKLAEQAIRLARLGAEREKRWGRVRLLGERRYGELLGPASAAKSGPKPKDEFVSASNEPLTPSERFAQHKAREVAPQSIPDGVFEEYVAEAERPTHAGLVRHAKMAVHYSSATDEWATPQDFYDRIAAEFAPELDVCCLESSAKCVRYFTPEDDGLAQEWAGVCWMNPPYGDEIKRWVRKAYESAENGATVVCLVPARTDTAWWHDFCTHAEVRLIRGRLRFGEAEASAPFPSALVVFGRPASIRNWDWRA